MPTQKELESPSAEDCSQAEAYNPEGVFAIQVGMLRSHFYYRLRLVAGYLKNCKNTRQLHQITISLQDLFAQYDEIKKSNWKLNIPCHDLFNFLTCCQSNIKLSVLVNNEQIPSEQDIASLGLYKSDLGPLITTNILIKVIKRFPRHFAEIYKYAPNESKHLPLFEDLHRAYAVLRMWYHLDTENKKTKLRWAPSKEQCRPALTIHYLDSYEPPKKELTDVAKLATKNPVPENQAKEKEYRHRSDQELKKKNDYYRYFMNRHLKSTEDDMFNKILSSEVHRHYL